MRRIYGWIILTALVTAGAEASEWDADGDGKVTFEEYMQVRQKVRAGAGKAPMTEAAGRKEFSKFDLNGDGVLNKDEVPSREKAKPTVG